MKSKKKQSDIFETDMTKIFIPCEWVIQFDNDEPQIFAVSKETDLTPEISIVLKNNSNSHITFLDTTSNKEFKIFARQKQ